jgi:hypothetical protein
LQTERLAPYNQLCLLASECHKVFVSQSESDLETSIDLLLNQIDTLLDVSPNLAGVILNTTNKNMHFVASFILKQACFSRSLCIKSKLDPDQIHSLIKASLLLLYLVLPELIAAKKDHKQLPYLKKALNSCLASSFQLAKKLKLTDNITLKLLSQIAGANTYSNANIYIQSLVVVSFNCTLSAFAGFNDKLTFGTALNRLLAAQSPLNIKQKQLTPYKVELSKLCNSLSDFNGALVKLRNKNLALLVEQNPSTLQFGIFEFSRTSMDDATEYEEVDAEQVRIILPQQIIDQTVLISLLASHKLDAETADQNEYTKLTSINGVNRYRADNDWRNISRSFLSNNNKTLCKVLSDYPEQSKLLLDYATEKNRQQQTVTDISHAIAMLGKDQLFPTLCNDNIKVKQYQVRKMGADVVNYKIDLFSHIASELHRHTNIGLPKYHELIGRILMIALMTIPKVSYAASSPARLAAPNADKTVCLSELFGLAALDNWKKISLLLSKSWLLPKVYTDIIEQYFYFLERGKRVEQDDKPINDNILLIILATYFFQHLINGKAQITEHQGIDTMLKSSKRVRTTLDFLYKAIRQSVTINTPLS